MNELIPAHAGVIPGIPRFSAAKTAYPRACGGDPNFTPNALVINPLSPRMRG